MAQISPEQVSSIVKSGFDILREASNLTSGRDPNYIRDAEPGNIIDALALAGARQGCRRYQQKGGDYSGARAARAERACRPYLDSLEAGTGPQLRKEFDGGQCPVRYFVQATWQNRNTSGELGPVQNQNVTSPLGRPGPIVSLRREGVPGSWQLVLTHGTDSLFTEPRSVVRSSTSTNSSFENITITGFTRVDGLPDSCGNPPPEFFPPKPPTIPLPPGPQPVVRSPDLNVDVGVTINPDFTINIDVGTGPITIDPFGDEGGDGGGGDEPTPPGFQGEPGTPVDVGPGGAADDTDPDRNLVGVLVQTIETPPRANQIFNETESYTKGAYFVYFGGDGGLALNPEGAITRPNQFFYAPEGANRFRVVPNVGFTIRVTPYYEDLE